MSPQENLRRFRPPNILSRRAQPLPFYFHDKPESREQQTWETVDASIGDFDLKPLGVEEIWVRIAPGLAEASKERKERDTRQAEEEVLQRFFKRSDVDVSVQIVVQGSDGILRFTIGDLLHAQKKGVLYGIGPHFPPPVTYARQHGIIYFPIEPKLSLDDPYDDIIRDAAEGEIAKDTRKNIAVYVSNPGSPTGGSASPEAIRYLAEITARKGYTLIVDEALADGLPDEESAILLVPEYPHMIAVRSVSKFAGLGGTDIAYAVMPKELGEEYTKLRSPFDISAVDQLFIPEILNPDFLLPNIQRGRDILVPEKEYFLNRLDEIDMDFIRETDLRVPFVLLRDDRLDSTGHYNFYSRLKNEAGLVTASMEPFGATYMQFRRFPQQYVRLTISSDRSRNEELLRRLAFIKSM